MQTLDKTPRSLAPEELPAANYVRNTVGALETRLAADVETPPASPRYLPGPSNTNTSQASMVSRSIRLVIAT